MTKDHFVPQFIIKKFADNNGNIHCFNKSSKEISALWRYKDQLFSNNLYSKKSLLELQEQFSLKTLNPIFKNTNETLEKNLNWNLETPLSKILDKIIEPILSKEIPPLSKDEASFIEEYIVIQHLRTISFKMTSRKYNEKFNLPPWFKETIIENEKNRELIIRKIIKNTKEGLNAKKRFEIEKSYKQKLKKNPNLLREIRENFLKSELDSMVVDAQKEIKEILLHPEKHSADIIDMKHRESFFKRCDIEHMNLRIILNETNIPFVLPDTGISILSDDPEGKINTEIYLSIHPKILLVLSKTLPLASLVGLNFVEMFNKAVNTNSYETIYSSSQDTLKKLVD